MCADVCCLMHVRLVDVMHTCVFGVYVWMLRADLVEWSVNREGSRRIGTHDPHWAGLK
jgi:hypothetical protein